MSRRPRPTGICLSTFRRWKAELDPNNLWLEHTTEKDTVILISCKVCKNNEHKLKQQRNANDAFVIGISGAALKKDNVVKHSKSDAHKFALRLEKAPLSSAELYSSTVIGKAFCSASEEQLQRISKLVEIAYVLAKEELPFKKFEKLIELEKSHGVSLGKSYANEKVAKELTMCIGECFFNNLKDSLLNDKCYFSLSIDGATDVSVQEQEAMYVTFLTNDGTVVTKLFRLKGVEHANAEGLEQLIKRSFDEVGISYDDVVKKRLVGFMSDGASVNFGCKTGVVSRLKKDMPWLVATHCLNHRLELAIKDAVANTYITDVCQMLMNIYYIYEKSPKRLRELRELASIMNEAVLKPIRAHGTRWIQHKCRAVEALLNNYEHVVSHIENMTEDKKVKSIDRAKMKGYLQILKSLKFVAYLLYFYEILRPLARLSQGLQGTSTTLVRAISVLEATTASLETLKCELPQKVKELFAASDASETREVNFRNVKLNAIAAGRKQFTTNQSSMITQEVLDCLSKRFVDFKTDKIFLALKILNVSAWPKNDKQQLEKFGIKEIKDVVTHFNLLAFGETAAEETVLFEWLELKLFVCANLSHLSDDEVWGVITSKYTAQYVNVLKVVTILRVLPVSNAVVERCFSTMRRVKTDWRNKLTEETIETLLRIKREGPPLAKFNSREAAEIFFKKRPRRPDVEEPCASGEKDGKKMKH